jgi:hypothetical protein
MNVNLAAAMRSAMNLISDQKLIEATRVIQSALSGAESVSPKRASKARVVHRAIHHKVIDLTAEVTEPEPSASAQLKTGTRLDQSQPKWDGGRLAKALGKLRHKRLPLFSLDGLTLHRSRKRLEVPEGAQFLKVLYMRGR